MLCWKLFLRRTNSNVRPPLPKYSNKQWIYNNIIVTLKRNRWQNWCNPFTVIMGEQNNQSSQFLMFSLCVPNKCSEDIGANNHYSSFSRLQPYPRCKQRVQSCWLVSRKRNHWWNAFFVIELNNYWFNLIWYILLQY